MSHMVVGGGGLTNMDSDELLMLPFGLKVSENKDAPDLPDGFLTRWRLCARKMRLDSGIPNCFYKYTAMEKDKKQNQTATPLESVSVIVRFITLMQRYSGQRDLKMDLPSDPSLAIQAIIARFDIPWKDNLEKRTRIFINKQFAESFIKQGEKLKTDDLIAFIPISGGG
jgi:hypothetical protein